MNSAFTDKICIWAEEDRFDKIYERMGEDFLVALKTWFESVRLMDKADLVQHTLDAMNMEISLEWEE